VDISKVSNTVLILQLLSDIHSKSHTRILTKRSAALAKSIITDQSSNIVSKRLTSLSMPQRQPQSNGVVQGHHEQIL